MQLPATVEVKGMKVLTTRQIAEAYGVSKDKIIYNFNYNKDRYVLGKHYIEETGRCGNAGRPECNEAEYGTIVESD